MRCLHCRVDFHDKPEFQFLDSDQDGHFGVYTVRCSACKRVAHQLKRGQKVTQGPGVVVGINAATLQTWVYPKASSRGPVPSEVPQEIAEDYIEACLVLSDSPKASAALSRRCLQHLLRTAAGVKHQDLAREIQEVLDSGKLPTYLADSIDAVRNVGNFSAHPIKSTSTGAILPVEPHEAEWTLEVLESLFDFYFVQPAALAKKRAALDEKLGSAGKPPLKK